MASMLGGLLVGMISSGLGEVNQLNFLKKLKMTLPGASGVSVFLVTMSAIVGVMLSNIMNCKFMGKFVGTLFIVLAILIILTILR